MAAYTFSEGTSRLLSFVFYVVAARMLTTDGFGVLRYTIALALLALGAVQVLVTAMTRELGATRGDPARTGEVLGSGLAVAAVLFAVTSALCVLASLLGLTGSAYLPGLLVVLAGLSVFQLYYAVGRGLGDHRRAVVSYAGGSIAQLTLLLLLAAVSDPGARVVLVVFGVSSALPLVPYELIRPAVLGAPLRVSRESVRRLWRVGGPLVLAQAGFLVWLSADQIWVESTLGTREIGLYGGAKNVVQIFMVLPTAATGVLLPRVAELRISQQTTRARRLLYATTVGVIALSALVGAAVLLARSELLGELYGAQYAAAAPALVGLTLGMVAYAGLVTVTHGAVGWGRPGLYALGMLLAVPLEIGCLLAFGGDHSSVAGWASGASMMIAFALVLLRMRGRPLEEG
jgi:O-antigen/teichoic acid export membrane protein